jgi:hypothetical protein
MAAKKPAAAKKSPAEKKPSLDIKDEMLYSDYKVFDWLDNQTPEMAKTFSPIVAMKWQSVLQSPTGYDDPSLVRATPEETADFIITVNEVVNQGFWDLSRYPDLQWRLMCAVGLGKPFKHGWIPLATSRKKVGKIDAVLLELYPQLNNEELSILRSKFTRESFKQLLLDMGKPDSDIKPLMDEFKKING